MKIKSIVVPVGLATATASTLVAGLLAKTVVCSLAWHSVAVSVTTSPLLAPLSNPFLEFIYFLLSFFFRHG